MGYETDILEYKRWVKQANKFMDKTTLERLRQDCKNNNHQGMYDELIELINEKLEI